MKIKLLAMILIASTLLINSSWAMMKKVREEREAYEEQALNAQTMSLSEN